MSIVELGALGEFVGSIAVLATLGFLSLQFRQFRQSLNSSTAHQTYQQLNQLNTILATDPRIAEVFERAFTEPASLNDMEQRQYAWMQTCYYNVLVNLYDQFQEGSCKEGLFLDVAYQLKWALSTPGGQLWKAQNHMREDVFAYLDDLPDIGRSPTPTFKLS